MKITLNIWEKLLSFSANTSKCRARRWTIKQAPIPNLLLVRRSRFPTFFAFSVARWLHHIEHVKLSSWKQWLSETHWVVDLYCSLRKVTIQNTASLSLAQGDAALWLQHQLLERFKNKVYPQRIFLLIHFDKYTSWAKNRFCNKESMKRPMQVVIPVE